MPEIEDNDEKAEDTTKNLPEQAEVLKKQIHDSKVVLVNAAKLVGAIEGYHNNLQEIQTKIGNALSSSEMNSATIEGLKKNIDLIKGQSTEILDNIKTDVATVTKFVAEMEIAYKSFQLINAEIINPSSGLDTTLKTAQGRLSEVEEVKGKANELLTKIQADLESISGNIITMSQQYDEFVIIKNEVFDEGTGLQAIFENSKKIVSDIATSKMNAQELVDAIDKLKIDASIRDNDIQALKDSAEKEVGKIIRHEQDSSALKEQISKSLKAISDLSLANNFGARGKEIMHMTWFWLFLSFCSILLLAFAVLVVFGHIFSFIQINPPTENPVLTILFRVSVTSPLLYLVYFTTSQYSRERSLLERYAFKAATGLSLTSYTLLLNTQFNNEKSYNPRENERDILEFTIASMKGIYKEPYEPFKKYRTVKDIAQEGINSFQQEIKNKVKNTRNVDLDVIGSKPE